MKKRILKNIKFLTVFGLIFSIALYIFFVNSWKLNLTKTELTEFVSEIKQAEKLPEKFYDLYNVEFDKSLENGIIMQTFNSFFFGKNKLSIRLSTARLYLVFNHKKYYKNVFFTANSLGLKIENNTSSKENLNWIMQNMEFSGSITGIKSASKYYFKKNLFDLNERELANLVVISKNPSLYNPQKRQDLIDRKVERLLNKANYG